MAEEKGRLTVGVQDADGDNANPSKTVSIVATKLSHEKIRIYIPVAD